MRPLRLYHNSPAGLHHLKPFVCFSELIQQVGSSLLFYHVFKAFDDIRLKGNVHNVLLTPLIDSFSIGLFGFHVAPRLCVLFPLLEHNNEKGNVLQVILKIYNKYQTGSVENGLATGVFTFKRLLTCQI